MSRAEPSTPLLPSLVNELSHSLRFNEGSRLPGIMKGARLVLHPVSFNQYPKNPTSEPSRAN